MLMRTLITANLGGDINAVTVFLVPKECIADLTVACAIALTNGATVFGPDVMFGNNNN